MSRRTHTSSEVKDRYNAKVYDQIIIRVAKGSRDTVQRLAAAHGMSVNGYIHHLIAADAAACGDDMARITIGRLYGISSTQQAFARFYSRALGRTFHPNDLRLWQYR